MSDFSDVPVEVARQLERLRQHLSIPQCTVAEALGVSVALESASSGSR
jgi:hypothetical protein